MKKKFIFIMISVVLLLSLTVNALAIKTGTFEWDKPLFCENTKKVVVEKVDGTSVKVMRSFDTYYFNGKKTLNIKVNCKKASCSINGGVPSVVKSKVGAASSINYENEGNLSLSWTVSSGKKVGYYTPQLKIKLNKYSFRYYERTSTIFETGSWTLVNSGTILDAGKNVPCYSLKYSATK